MHDNQCATYPQMDEESEVIRSILSISICYARWTWTRRGKLLKRKGRWKSCGNSMLLTYGEFSTTYKHRVGGYCSEPKFTSDGVTAVFRREFPKAIGTWICLLIKGGDTPTHTPPPSPSLPSKASGH